MNYHYIMGRITAKFNYILKNIGFKNIKTFNESDGIIKIQLKDNTEAEIRYFSPETAYVVWSVNDFISKAQEEQKENWYNYFDETKFYGALHEMIRKHDANEGITWYTISYYLNEYCKK